MVKAYAIAIALLCFVVTIPCRVIGDGDGDVSKGSLPARCNYLCTGGEELWFVRGTSLVVVSSRTGLLIAETDVKGTSILCAVYHENEVLGLAYSKRRGNRIKSWCRTGNKVQEVMDVRLDSVSKSPVRIHESKVWISGDSLCVQNDGEVYEMSLDKREIVASYELNRRSLTVHGHAIYSYSKGKVQAYASLGGVPAPQVCAEIEEPSDYYGFIVSSSVIEIVCIREGEYSAQRTLYYSWKGELLREITGPHASSIFDSNIIQWRFDAVTKKLRALVLNIVSGDSELLCENEFEPETRSWSNAELDKIVICTNAGVSMYSVSARKRLFYVEHDALLLMMMGNAWDSSYIQLSNVLIGPNAKAIAEALSKVTAE